MSCQRLGRLNVAAVGLAMSAFAGSAAAVVINQDLFYTRNSIPVNEFNVKKVAVAYDQLNMSHAANMTLTRTNIAQVCGADGIIFANSSIGAPLIVTAQYQAFIHQVNPNTLTWDGYRDVGNGNPLGYGAYHVTLDPAGGQGWVSGELPRYPFNGLPGTLSLVSFLGISNSTAGIFPFSASCAGQAPFPSPSGPAGTTHNIKGDEDNVISVAFTPDGSAWYCASAGPNDTNGNFGRLPSPLNLVVGDINTTQLQGTKTGPSIEGFHGLHYDPYIQRLVAVGHNRVLSVDPTSPTTFTFFDFSAHPDFPQGGIELDQAAPDGKGRLYIADNNGYLYVLDYTNSQSVANPDNYGVAYLDANLDDIAPVLGAPPTCCALGTGAYDMGNPQESQLTLFPSVTDRRTADDFYIQPNEVARLHSITATLITNVDTINPGTNGFFYKAQLELYASCGCKPTGAPIKTITKTLSAPTKTGSAGGYDEIEFVFDLDNCILKGGPTGTTYWVSVIGLGSQNASTGEQWFWGSAGHGTVQGCPGVFKSVSGGDTDWVGVDTLCCGCRDFNFCINADICKVLLDNGTYKKTSFCGSESRARHNTAIDDIFTADQFVTPTCGELVSLCYIEAYVISNCPNFSLKIWDNDCKQPNHLKTTLIPDRVIEVCPDPAVPGSPCAALTGAPPGYPNLKVRCLQFWTNLPLLNPGQTYWLSAYGVFDGSLNQGSWFACNGGDCQLPCPIRFFPASIKGKSFVTPGLTYDQWTPTGNDMAFLVAIHTDSSPQAAAASARAARTAACPGDFNGVDGATVQDIFDFLAAFFAGCH